MPFTKVVPKKGIELDDDGYASEVIDLKLQYQILRGESIEEVRTALIRRVDKCVSQMFAAELKLMPERLEEGERWKQHSMFGDAL